MPESESPGQGLADMPPPAAVQQRPLRILVADDDEINRAIVGHMLSALPHSVMTEAADGRAALELAQTQRFDLLIFDLNMPEIDGDRLIRHLRASQSLNADSPMILFSAATDRSGRIEGRAPSLADLVLPKPIPAAEFLSAIGRLTGRR